MKDEDNTMMRFSELVDIQEIQRLLERHFKITNIPISIPGKDQNRLVAVGLQDICTKFHRVHPVTLEHCQQSDAIIKSHLNEGRYMEYKVQIIRTPIYNIEGQVTGILGIFWDITEHKRLDIQRCR